MKWLLLSVVLLMVILPACKHDGPAPASIAGGNYPAEVGNILVAKCAVAGCHNAASYANAADVLLDTWEHLFRGGTSGAEVVPYSPDYSPLLYFVNTDPAQGVVAEPTMPLSNSSTHREPLTKSEYAVLKNWIANGAPDKNGNIAFAANPDTRQKIYITQQGCDQMAVIDAQSHLIMRYIPVGTLPAQVESPHCTRVSSDGMNAYVSFLGGNYIQKADTRTDKITAAANVGYGSWNILYPAPADTALVASNWRGNGALAYFTTAGMAPVKPLYNSGALLVYPHGITSNRAFDTFFVTAQYGNTIYKLSATQLLYKKISLNGLPAVTTTSTSNTNPDPHEILMLHDYSRYFVSCQGSNEVKLMDAHADIVIATIPVGISPQEMALSTTKPYLFVTCTEDNTTVSGMKGSVYMINYNTLETRKIEGDFYQPHGIAVDDINGVVYIASTNANPAGPAPHHATACGGRAGWYSLYDLNTLQPLNRNRYQMLVMPYSAAVRFR
ncbi:MAG: hypothetical protein H7257_13820 [Taibaiella sp.]|nr:hypothetical protein [Taibaiella sp.]